MGRNQSKLGKEYGLLTVIEDLGGGIVTCRCLCGNTKRVAKCHVVSGKIDNCGCLKNTRRQKTCQEKYGVSSVSQVKSVQEKKKGTIQERYGADTWFGSEAGKEAVKVGLMATLGVDNASKAESVKQKKTETSQSHYGVSNPMQNKDLVEEKRQRHFSKYGCYAPMQRPEVRQRAMRLRDGKMIWPSALPENQEKTRATCLKRYGSSQLMDIPEKRKLAAINSARANSRGISKIETQIKKWVESLGLKTEHTAINGSYLDVWVPELKIAIEYHGSVWHSVDGPKLTDKRKQYLKTLHRVKQESAERDNYRLIQIWEPWWRHRTKQMKGYLKAAFGIHSNKVGARSLTLREVSSPEANSFFEDFHVLGGRNGVKAIGLYTKEGLLVACASFSNGSHNTKELTMSRWCVREDWLVVGGLSRVTAWALKEWKQDLYTTADLALSDGHGYEKTGWKQVSTWYDYFYVHKNVPCCIPKRQRSKGRCGCPEGMTEHEWALAGGFMRIYDAGKRKYVYRYDPSL